MARLGMRHQVVVKSRLLPDRGGDLVFAYLLDGGGEGLERENSRKPEFVPIENFATLGAGHQFADLKPADKPEQVS